MGFNEHQMQVIKDSSLEEIKDCLDGCDEILEHFESLLDLLADDSVLSNILREFLHEKKMLKEMNEFRKARNIVYDAYLLKKDICHAR